MLFISYFDTMFDCFRVLLQAAFEGIKEGVFAAKHGFSDDGRYVTNTASQTVVPADKNNTEIGGILQ